MTPMTNPIRVSLLACSAVVRSLVSALKVLVCVLVEGVWHRGD
jgi:hypothetical protein